MECDYLISGEIIFLKLILIFVRVDTASIPRLYFLCFFSTLLSPAWPFLLLSIFLSLHLGVYLSISSFLCPLNVSVCPSSALVSKVEISKYDWVEWIASKEPKDKRIFFFLCLLFWQGEKFWSSNLEAKIWFGVNKFIRFSHPDRDIYIFTLNSVTVLEEKSWFKCMLHVIRSKCMRMWDVCLVSTRPIMMWVASVERAGSASLASWLSVRVYAFFCPKLFLNQQKRLTNVPRDLKAGKSEWWSVSLTLWSDEDTKLLMVMKLTLNYFNKKIIIRRQLLKMSWCFALMLLTNNFTAFINKLTNE